MEKKVDISEKIIRDVSKSSANFYDKYFLNMVNIDSFFTPKLKIIGYKKVKVPIYFQVSIPIIEKHYDEDGEYEGLLIKIEKKKLFKVGTKIEEQPVYKKIRKSNKPIKFTRYSDINNVKKTS